MQGHRDTPALSHGSCGSSPTVDPWVPGMAPQLWSWWVLVPELTYLPRPWELGLPASVTPQGFLRSLPHIASSLGQCAHPTGSGTPWAMLGWEREEAWALRHWQGLPCSHMEFLSAIRISRGGCPISSSHWSLCLGASEGQGLGRCTETANTYLSLK